MKPTLKEQLNDLVKLHPELAPKKKNKRQRKRPKKAKLESLTESDIKDLMGVYKRTLRRGKGGAWR